MSIKSMKPKVRRQPQYKPHPTKTIITGYVVFAYTGVPAFKIKGTTRIFKGEKGEQESKKYAKSLREAIST